MKKKVMLILLGFIGLSFAQLQVGDTISYYMNIFRLILERDTLPRKGVVRYVGDNFYLISGDRVSVLKIARRNYSSYPDSFAYLAGTIRTAGKDPQYFYSSTDLVRWSQNRSLSGADAAVDQDTTPTGNLVNTLDLDIYDIATNPSADAVTSYSSVYVASTDGLFGLNQAMSSASWIAMPDTAVFSAVFHPDSAGPIGPSNPLANEVLFIGTAKGVYHVTVDIYDFSIIKQLADYNRMGSLTDTVYAVGVDPNNAKILYAGTSNKIYEWDSTTGDWQAVKSVTGKVHRIKFFGSQKIVVTTADGIWYTEDAGATWDSALTGKDVWDVEYAYNYYWAATAGDGVFRSSSLTGPWGDISNGLESLASVGSKLCYSIFYDSAENKLLLGNEQGVWIWDTGQSKWVNISKGIGSIIPESEVNTLAQAIENPFGNNKNLFDSLNTILQVTPDELWDIDNDPHIYIVLSGLTVSTNLQDPTLTPIYGYFDPYDEDPSNPYSNGTEIFVLDVGNFYDKTQGEYNVSYIARFIGYLYSLYAIWSLDRNESPALRAGLAIDALHLTGFNVFGDTVAIIGGRAWGSDKDHINTPLLSFTTAWVRAPVAREMDRERVGYFIEYLRERFGDQIFYDLLRDRRNDYYEAFDSVLAKRGYKFEDVFSDWVIANLLDNPDSSFYDGKYGYSEIDNIFNYSQPDQFSSVIPDSAKRHFVVSPTAVTYWRQNDSLIYHLDLEDNFGDTIRGFRLYRILNDTIVTRLEFDTLYEYVIVGNDTIEILKKARNALSDTVVGDVRYVIVNTSRSLSGTYSLSYEKSPPQVYASYILQNPVVTHSLDFYVLSKEYFYGDADNTSRADVSVVPLTPGLSKSEVPLEYIGNGDTTYIFHASLMLSSDIEGDLVVYSYAQDLAGLETILYYDTIGVRKISGGGLYTFLNGKVSIEIPAHMDYHNLIVVSRVKGMKDEYTVGNAYSVGGPGIQFPEEVKLIFKSPLFAGRKDISLYRYNGEKWIECRSYVNSETGEVVAYVDRLGIFAIKTGNPVSLPTKFNFALKSSNILPFSHGISLQFALPCKSDVSLSIFDITGRRVYSRTLKSLSAGFYNYKIKPDVTKGVYIMRFKAISGEKEYSRSLKLILF